MTAHHPPTCVCLECLEPKVGLIPWEQRCERTSLEVMYRRALLDVLKMCGDRIKDMPDGQEPDNPEAKNLEQIMIRLAHVPELF